MACPAVFLEAVGAADRAVQAPGGRGPVPGPIQRPKLPRLTPQWMATVALMRGIGDDPVRRERASRNLAYNLKTLRARERAIGEQAERAYQTLVAHWRPQPRKRGTGAARRTA